MDSDKWTALAFVSTDSLLILVRLLPEHCYAEITVQQAHLLPIAYSILAGYV